MICLIKTSLNLCEKFHHHHSIVSAFFFAEADTKKHRHASAKASTFADCQGKFQTLHQNLKYLLNIHYICHRLPLTCADSSNQLHFSKEFELTI